MENEIIQKITDYLVGTHKDYILFISLLKNENKQSAKNYDTEFLLITDGIDYERNQEIMKYLRENFSGSLSVTFTSKKETANLNILNYKTMLGLYLAQKGLSDVLYHNQDFTFQIDENILKSTSSTLCSNEISKIINIVADFDNLPNKIQGQYTLKRLVYLALQKYFISLNIFPKNLNEAFAILKDKFSFDLEIDVEKVLNQENNTDADYEKLKKACFEIAEFLLERQNERKFTNTISQDIRVRANDVTYKVRAGGLVEFNGKFLLVKMGLGSYWCVPGGHLEWFENSENAVIREVEEETKMPVVVQNLFLLHENFYLNVKNQKFHEMCFYYLLKPKNENKVIKDEIREEFDKDKKDVLEFKWFTKAEIQNLDIKPTIIKDIILSDKIYSMNHEIKRNIND